METVDISNLDYVIIEFTIKKSKFYEVMLRRLRNKKISICDKDSILISGDFFASLKFQ